VDRLIDHLLSEPRRLVAVRSALVRFGGFVLITGLVGHAATTAVTAAKGIGGSPRVDVPLADVLPGYPSFWMPESALGFGVALLLVGVGLAAARTGRAYERHM
jgi:hypothetical protein